MSKNVTIKISLQSELKKGLKLSSSAINNTANDTKTFWVGYNQAFQDINNRFFNDKK